MNLSYLADPYAASFVKGRPGPSSRRPPLINVGTHARTYALDLLVKQFLDAPYVDGLSSEGKGKGKQIVSLGAGSDTRFFRLMVSAPDPGSLVHH